MTNITLFIEQCQSDLWVGGIPELGVSAYGDCRCSCYEAIREAFVLWANLNRIRTPEDVWAYAHKGTA